MSNEKNRIVLQRIIERIARAEKYCADLNYNDFESNTMLQEACVFNVFQIGELSKQGLSEDFIQLHPDIPWKQMYGLRNRIVHGYEGIRLNIVWDTIRDDFPILRERLQALLAE